MQPVDPSGTIMSIAKTRFMATSSSKQRATARFALAGRAGCGLLRRGNPDRGGVTPATRRARLGGFASRVPAPDFGVARVARGLQCRRP
jgi:hypothetical protein